MARDSVKEIKKPHIQLIRDIEKCAHNRQSKVNNRKSE